MATMITGSTDTSHILSNQIVVDMADKIYLLEPNAAPLYVLVSKLNKRVATNTTIEWLEDELNPSWFKLRGGTASAFNSNSNCISGAISASDKVTYLNYYDLVKIPVTGEIILITWVGTDATSTFSATRAAGGSTAASAQTGVDAVIIGSAFPEGSLSTDLYTRSTQTSRVSNYLQIFRKSVQISKTLANTELYGGEDRNYQRKKKGIELMRDLERAFLFGGMEQDTSTSSTGYIRQTGGIGHFISTNSTAVGGTMTETEFEGFLRCLFRYGSSTRYLFCAPIVLSVVSMWAQGKLQTFSKDKTYGIAISQYLSPSGTINLVKETLLENTGGPSSGALSTDYYGGYAYAIELEELVYRYLQNRDVQFETEIQHPGDDYFKDQYICEVGMEFHSEKKHAELTGVTG
jgi:hypothetical protein